MEEGPLSNLFLTSLIINAVFSTFFVSLGLSYLFLSGVGETVKPFRCCALNLDIIMDVAAKRTFVPVQIY
jgi:hypothetical protein